MKYIDEQLGGSTKVLIVPECGHNDRCVYTTDSVLPVIFPAAPQSFLAGALPHRQTGATSAEAR